MNTKQKIVWGIYLLIFVVVWYVVLSPPTSGNNVGYGNSWIGGVVLSLIILAPTIILHKILKDKK